MKLLNVMIAFAFVACGKNYDNPHNTLENENENNSGPTGEYSTISEIDRLFPDVDDISVNDQISRGERIFSIAQSKLSEMETIFYSNKQSDLFSRDKQIEIMKKWEKILDALFVKAEKNLKQAAYEILGSENIMVSMLELHLFFDSYIVQFSPLSQEQLRNIKKLLCCICEMKTKISSFIKFDGSSTFYPFSLCSKECDDKQEMKKKEQLELRKKNERIAKRTRLIKGITNYFVFLEGKFAQCLEVSSLNSLTGNYNTINSYFDLLKMEIENLSLMGTTTEQEKQELADIDAKYIQVQQKRKEIGDIIDKQKLRN